MADSKITALTALTAADPANDMIPIVDVSDTPPASGNTKRISINNILACSPSATLASATITGDLTVATNKLKVTGGNVGIGTATPTNYANYTTLTINGTNGGEIDLTDGGTLRGQLFSESTGLTLAAVGGFIKFGAGTGGLEAMRLNSTANLVLKGGTAGANGVGVTFPATQVASSDANCLDDYEEGTFTPTVLGSTIAGTGTYSTQAGYYTKVGNLVTASVFLVWTAHTGTGIMYFGGLPFTSSSSTNSLGAASVSYVNNITLTASNVFNLLIGVGQSYLESYQYPVGGGAATQVSVDVSGSIIYTVTYRV